MATRRAPADPVDGVLALDKPLGVSSNTALQHARRLLQARKAGHTGTLDPLASGLLPLTFGEATKFSADLLDADKEYEACIALGSTTTTGDGEGDGARDPAGDRRPRAVRCGPGALPRQPAAGAADAFGAQARGPAAVRAGARRAQRGACAARHRDHAPRAAALGSGGAGGAGRMQQGHLRARAGPGHRRGPGLRRPSARAAPHRGWGRCGWRRRSRSSSSRRWTWRRGAAACCRRTRWWAACPACTWMRPPARASGTASACRGPMPGPACACMAPMAPCWAWRAAPTAGSNRSAWWPGRPAAR